MKLEVTAEELIELGVSEVTAHHVINKVLEVAEDHDLEECWPALTAEVLNASLPFAAHQYIYNALNALWPQDDGPMPAWMPSLAIQFNSNIHSLLQKKDLHSYDALYAWSIENPASFWGAIADTLGIRFREPYNSVVDLSNGFPAPNWFPGAKLNIADSCFQSEEEKPAIVWQKNAAEELVVLSYGDLDRFSNRVANGLRDAGFKAGDALAIDMTMTLESVVIYLGVVKAGCRVISIADSFTPSEIATRLRIGNAAGVFTMDLLARGDKQLPMYAKVCEAEAPKTIVLPLGESLTVDLRDGDLAWRDFLSDDDAFTSVACDPHDVTNILFSSGTTGEPKAITWNHTTPIKAAMDGYIHQDIHAEEVVCWPTNLGWMMGPWLIYATLVNKGCIALYGDAPNTQGFCKFVEQAEVNVLGVVPSLVKAWKQTGALDSVHWRNIKLFSSTGECSNAEDMLFLMSQAGYAPVMEYCGGTEIGGGYLSGTVVHPGTPSMFTTPCLGLSIKILDEEENETDDGQLFIANPSIGLSTELLNRDHLEEYYTGTPHDADGNPYRRHGDQIVKRPGGYFQALGRVDDTMNLGGIKTSSAEIERVILELADVDEVAAIGVPPIDGGPSQLIIFAVMLVEREMDALIKELQGAIRTRLNPLFKIHEIVLSKALPRTASGKVMRRVLRRRYLDDRGN